MNKQQEGGYLCEVKRGIRPVYYTTLGKDPVYGARDHSSSKAPGIKFHVCVGAGLGWVVLSAT